LSDTDIGQRYELVGYACVHLRPVLLAIPKP
jgi:hypothetical protein